MDVQKNTHLLNMKDVRTYFSLMKGQIEQIFLEKLICRKKHKTKKPFDFGL